MSAPAGRGAALRLPGVAVSLIVSLFAAAAAMTYLTAAPARAPLARPAAQAQVLPADWKARVEAQRARQKRELASNAAYMARLASVDRDALAGRAPPELAPGQDLKVARVAP